jgi:hypothetical protein
VTATTRDRAVAVNPCDYALPMLARPERITIGPEHAVVASAGAPIARG